jgi:2-amino-4-hydroxy-6-hydroxymethyldihydropteridine diphosphokinase
MPEPVYISVASNIDPERNIEAALACLAEVSPVMEISRFYLSPAIDRPDQPDYVNGMVRIVGSWTPHDLKFSVLRPLEQALGRVRTEDRYAARTLDLDIVLFGGLVIRERDLEVPDPELRSRPFLAAALLDLEPGVVLPDTAERLIDLVDMNVLRALPVAENFSQKVKERWMT